MKQYVFDLFEVVSSDADEFHGADELTGARVEEFIAGSESAAVDAEIYQNSFLRIMYDLLKDINIELEYKRRVAML